MDTDFLQDKGGGQNSQQHKLSRAGILLESMIQIHRRNHLGIPALQKAKDNKIQQGTWSQ
jgi:hypothetical protein